MATGRAMNFTIFCDELSDELLAKGYLCKGPLAGARIERLPALSRAPDLLKPLLRWERHDWVVVRDGVIVCTVEFSRHGYTGDNSFQRFARLFRAAALGAPTIYFTPFHRTRLNELDAGLQAPRNVAPELFQALLRMSDTFGVACLALHWPTALDGTAAPLTSPAATPQLEHLCSLVQALATADPAESRDIVAADFPDVLAAMKTQAALDFLGTATRGPLQLPAVVESSQWVWNWLPEGYFGGGKADKVLAALALGNDRQRSIVGNGQRFWTAGGEAWVLFLGYQWRPDPACGLIALAAETAVGKKLPRVFYDRASKNRQAALKALAEFEATGTGPVYDQAVTFGLDAEAIERFRLRVSTDDKQFGAFAANSKAGRILSDVASAVVLGDVVLLPAP